MRHTRKSLLLFLLIFSSAPLASVARAQSAAPTAADLEDAKKSFATGVALLQDPDAPRYDEALLHFRRAYELSGSWKALGNLALCLFKLERDGEAIEAYEKYLQAAGKKLDAADRAQAERDLQGLKAQVVTVGAAFARVGRGADRRAPRCDRPQGGQRIRGRIHQRERSGFTLDGTRSSPSCPPAMCAGKPDSIRQRR